MLERSRSEAPPQYGRSTLKKNLSYENHKKESVMSTITTKDGTQIYYKDWGSGQPLFFHHGWPLSADDWDAQMMFFLDRGHRVIAHDRRGHGRSTQTVTGNEMDTYAADVNELVENLDLREAIHIGPHLPASEALHQSVCLAG